MRKQTFIQGAMILMAAGILNRILGFVPRMMLPRIIGAEGVGLYQMGYPMLNLFLTFITGGIPLAVSKLVAEADSEGNEHKVRGILQISMIVSVSLGLLFTAACITQASFIAGTLFTDARVRLILIVMSPIILIVSFSAVFRGYFQGRHNMIPSALSLIGETVIRSAAVLVLAWLFLPAGLEYGAAGAMGGVLIGELGALAVLFANYRASLRKPAAPPQSGSHPEAVSCRLRHLLRRFLNITVPVTASRLVGSASYFLESVMIIRSLAVTGIAARMATAQYGALQGMVMPIILLPTALTYSLSVSLIPALSEAAARQDRITIHKRLHQSLRLAVVTGAPFAVAMIVLAEPICLYLYNDASVAPLLQMAAPFAVFIYMQSPFQAALQALDRPGNALMNTFAGAAVKLVLIYLLAARLEMGIVGAVLAIGVNSALVTVLHWHSVRRFIGFRLQFSDLLKTGFSAALMAAVCLVFAARPLMEGFAGFLLTLAFAAAVYGACIVRMKLVDPDDLRRIPWIGRWIAIRR